VSGHLLKCVVKILKTIGRRHEEILKPKGPILRLWAPKDAFTKACSRGWRSEHKLRCKNKTKLIGAGFTKACSRIRMCGLKRSYRAKLLKPRVVNP